MRKFLFSTRTHFRSLLVGCALLFLTADLAVAQCGFSFFNEGGTQTPQSFWSPGVSIGSGTFTNFNVVPGRIYSFRYSSSSLLPYVWDMTLSNSGGLLNYNNFLTPVRDPWSGGACPATPRPGSAEWYSASYGGVMAVHTHSWSAGTNCVAHIPGQGSAILTYKECIPSADPGSGSNVWNVEAFATTDIDIPVPAARYGYYTETSSSFNTQTKWNNLLNPSVASTWTGCEVPDDQFTIRGRRTGFPCGRYIITLIDAQDDFRLFINGNQLYSSTTPGQIADIVLGATDNVEIRMVGTCGADLANVSFALQPGFNVIAPGTISGVSDVCEGFPIGTFGSVTPASGGVAGLNNGGSIIYSWEYSINGGPYSVIPGAISDTYNSAIIIPPGNTYSFIRRATDRCGNTDISNVITVTARQTPNGSMSPTSQTICPGSIPFITLNFTPGTGPFNINYTDGSITYSRTGKNNGDTLQLDPGNYSFTSITDVYGCVRTSGFTSGAQVLQAQGITFSLSKADASCANVFDGRIDVNVFNGTPPLSYSLNGGPLQPGATFSGLYAGFYTITVYDAFGCSKTDTITINNTYIISVSLDSSSNISCYGGADGSLTVHVNGGVPPYSYSRNGFTFDTSGTFTGLSAGTYIIIGRDAKGCTESVNVTIAQPSSPVTVTVDSITNVLCADSGGGAIYITPSGGTPGYTFNWSPGGASSEDITGLVAGTYNVTVTDSRGCPPAIGGATVTEPLPLFLNIATYNDLQCNGDSSGAIDVTANGGVPSYSFVWSNGAITEDIANLDAANYIVTVTDANGCNQTISQNITEPSAITSSTSSTNVICFGGSNGSANVVAGGGTPPYFYLWSNFQATPNLAGVSGGLYYVVITDNNGCEKRDSVLINEPLNPLVLSIADTSISCFNENDGVINLTVTGGTVPYTYEWRNGGFSVFATTEDLDSLAGGTYVVTVTDANGCTASVSAVIINPAEIGTNYVITNPLCFGTSDGAIDLITSGGTPIITWLWNTGDTTEDISNKAAGIYSVIITDSRNCQKYDTVEITQPEQGSTTGFIKHVTCHGDDDGEINITPYGGTPPYSFHWGDSASALSTEDRVSLPGDSTYYVWVYDANNCLLAISPYTVNEPDLPLSADIIPTAALCFGTNTGVMVVVPSGGTTPYEYLWNDFFTDSIRSGVAAGRYVVLVTDSNGCQTYDSIDITEPTEIRITGGVVTNVSCNGSQPGAIDSIVVSGGVSPYTYIWSNGATTLNITNLVAGTYTLTVTDASGCIKTATFTVNETIGLFTTVSVSHPTCFGGNNGFISVIVTGGTLPYVYNWSTTSPNHGATATNLGEGTYTLTVSDANNCSATPQATLFDPAPIVVTTTTTPSKCYNTATGVVTASVTGGTAPYVYQLNGIIQPSNTFTNLLPGDYIIAVRDANGCEGTSTFTITAPVEVTVDLVATQDVIYQGMTTQLIATASPQVPAITAYTWTPLTDSAGLSIFSFDDCLDSNNCSNPYVTPHFTTLFTVSVMNADSCFGYDTVTVTVEVQPSSFIPTAFTPNGDERNDRFEFDILGATNIEVSIFNRWGERVFYHANQKNGIGTGEGWDGKKDGKPLPYDTYVYQMKISYAEGINPQGLEIDKAGTITIVR